jgi:hypothetical protein
MQLNEWKYVGCLLFASVDLGEGSCGYCLIAFSHKAHPDTFTYDVAYWHSQLGVPSQLTPSGIGADYHLLYPVNSARYLDLANPRPFAFLEWIQSYVHFIESLQLTIHRSISLHPTSESCNSPICRLVQDNSFHIAPFGLKMLGNTKSAANRHSLEKRRFSRSPSPPPKRAKLDDVAEPQTQDDQADQSTSDEEHSAL